jgi:hypothetical protein
MGRLRVVICIYYQILLVKMMVGGRGRRASNIGGKKKKLQGFCNVNIQEIPSRNPKERWTNIVLLWLASPTEFIVKVSRSHSDIPHTLGTIPLDE